MRQCLSAVQAFRKALAVVLLCLAQTCAALEGESPVKELAQAAPPAEPSLGKEAAGAEAAGAATTLQVSTTPATPAASGTSETLPSSIVDGAGEKADETDDGDDGDDDEDSDKPDFKSTVMKALVEERPPWNVKGNNTMEWTESYIQSSPLLGYFKAIRDWLANPDAPQLAIGIVAQLFGLVVAGASRWIWSGLAAFVVAILGAGFFHYEDLSMELVGGSLVLQLLFALQVAGVLGVATFLGIGGLQVLVGAIVGLFAGVSTCLWPSLVMGRFIWYSLWTILGAVAMAIFDLAVVATLLPLLGGLIFAGGFGTVLGLFSDSAWFPAEPTFWDATSELLGPHGVWLLGLLMAIGLLGAVGMAAGKAAIVAPTLLGVGLFITSIATVSGWGCGVIHRCPELLEPADHWQWPLLGCTLWTLVACGTAFGQAVFLYPLLPGAADNLSPEEDRMVRRICEAAGVDRTTALMALREAGGDVDAAAEQLLIGGGSLGGGRSSATSRPKTMRGRQRPTGLSLAEAGRSDGNQYAPLQTTRHATRSSNAFGFDGP